MAILSAGLAPITDRLGVQPNVISPAPRGEWAAVLSADPYALVSQSPAWLECVCTLEGAEDASRYYEWPDGRRLILPLVRRRYGPGLTRHTSLAEGWGIGGPIGSTAITCDDIELLLNDLKRLDSIQTSIRPNPLSGAIWAAARVPGVVALPKMAHVLDLSGGFEAVWRKRFSSATRTKIRKAERSGLVVECDTTGRLVPVFFDLLQQSIERWARQQHEPLALARWRAQRRDPLRKFQHIARQLGAVCRVWVAWANREPAAAIIVLQDQNAHYTRGAMNKALATSTRANDLLQRLAIEDACQAGCRYYHMGESGSSTALASFKSRFGAEAHAYAEYRVERWPLTRLERRLRGLVKRLIGFRDGA